MFLCRFLYKNRRFAAVRLGNFGKFLEVVAAYTSYFENDGTVSLVARLQKNVVLTALKQMSIVYSRIRIENISKKLSLSSDDAQCIVANVSDAVHSLSFFSRRSATA